MTLPAAALAAGCRYGQVGPGMSSITSRGGRGAARWAGGPSQD